MLRSLVVIPARLASTRLPRKLLLRETGKFLLQHTVEAATQARLPTEVIVAADGPEIAEAVRQFGGRCLLTDPACASGSDRVAEVACARPDIDLFVNVQGDEPEIDPESIDRVIRLLEKHPEAAMATLATPLRSRERLNDPSCVKVVFDQFQRALYFSRSPIPFAREWSDSLLQAHPPLFYQHIGLYAYRRDFLLLLSGLPRSDLERVENLEQLRVLSNGHTILVESIDEPTVGVDTPADYAEFVARMRNKANAETKGP